MTNVYYLKENYPGEYIKMTTFNSSPLSPPVKVPAPEPLPPLTEAPPSQQPDEPHPPQERTIDIFVSFKLRGITAEFPTVSMHWLNAPPILFVVAMVTGLGQGGTKGFPPPLSLHGRAECAIGLRCIRNQSLAAC